MDQDETRMMEVKEKKPFGMWETKMIVCEPLGWWANGSPLANDQDDARMIQYDDQDDRQDEIPQISINKKIKPSKKANHPSW